MIIIAPVGAASLMADRAGKGHRRCLPAVVGTLILSLVIRLFGIRVHVILVCRLSFVGQYSVIL
jgi:hypothetical protein